MATNVSDEAFARCLNQIGGATLEQIEAARLAQAASAQQGVLISLADVLIRQGIVTPALRENVEKKAQAAQQGGIQQLGHYKLLKKLGEGGMGAVYLAEDTMLLRKVALKVLPKQLGADAEFLTRFQREATATGKLNHVNIVAAYDAGEDQGRHYYAMEYCDGEPLDALLKRQNVFASEKALEIVMQVARGLQHAHEHGFIHRDIKPANIFVTNGGVAKILDLGLSKNIGAGEQSFNTQTGVALGTPHYISPEQAIGEKKIDGRTDIYSLGAAFYHLVTGQTPFDGSTAALIMLKHLNEQLPNPQDLREDIPDGVAHIIQRMLAKDPSDRYRDCGELLADLELVSAGHAPSSLALDALKSSVAVRARPLGARRHEPVPPLQKRLNDRRAADCGAGLRPAPYEQAGSLHHNNSRKTLAMAAGVTALILLGLVVVLMSRNQSAPQEKQASRAAAEKKKDDEAAAARLEEDRRKAEEARKVEEAARALAQRTPEPARIPSQTVNEPPLASATPNEAAWANAIDLLKLVDPRKDAVAGIWKRQDDGSIISDQAAPASIEIPYEPPEEYDLWVEFTRSSGSDAACVTYPQSGKSFFCDLGRTGRSWLANLETGRKYKIVLRVRQSDVALSIDGVPTVTWKGNMPLAAKAVWKLKHDSLLGLGSWLSPTIFHKFALLEVTGKGTFTRTALQATPPPDPTPAVPADPHAGLACRFDSPAGVAAFRGAFTNLQARDMALVFEDGQALFRRTKPGQKEWDKSGALHVQADAIMLGRNWDLSFKVALNVREQDVPLHEDAPRKGTFLVCFHAPAEKAQPYCEVHVRFALVMETGTGGRLVGRLLDKGQRNNDIVKAGLFEGMKNSGFSKGKMMQGGKTLSPASADGRYSVQLSMRGDAFKAVVNGQTVVDEPLPSAAVTLIENSPLALYAEAAGHNPEIALEELVFTRSSAPDAQPADAVDFQGHKYKVYRDKLAWPAAKKRCEELGGHLATLTSKAEHDFVTALARKTGAEAWIGLTDERQEGQWEWVTGEKFEYANWGQGEPDGGQKENYADLWSHKNWNWCDFGGANAIGFVCEWEPAAAPDTQPPVAGAVRPWMAIFDGKTLDCLSEQGKGVWRVENGALTKVPGSIDLSAQTQEQFGDGELRIRFEHDVADWLGFAVRQGAGGKFTAEWDKATLAKMAGKPHELIFTCVGKAASALLDGQPVVLATKGNPIKGSLQFNVTKGNVRVTAIEYRELVAQGVAAVDDAFVREVAALPPDQQVERVVAKLKELNPAFDSKQISVINGGKVTALTFSTDSVSNISPLRALTKLEMLNCSGSNKKGILADLSSLKGLALKTLYCLNNTKLADLKPLNGMPLTCLVCTGTSISDLSPLRGMKLKELQCSNTQVADLSPLKGMPLILLSIADTHVSDLSALNGMPLAGLHCNGTKVTDLSPLQGIPLKVLICPFKPERDAAILRAIKTLETINNKPAAEFWKQ